MREDKPTWENLTDWLIRNLDRHEDDAPSEFKKAGRKREWLTGVARALRETGKDYEDMRQRWYLDRDGDPFSENLDDVIENYFQEFKERSLTIANMIEAANIYKSAGGVDPIEGSRKRREQTKRNQANGRKPKRRIWADEAAKKLRRIAPELTKEQAWNYLPEADCPWEFRRSGYKVYRDIDGGYIYADHIKRCVEEKVKKSTFFKEYLRKKGK